MAKRTSTDAAATDDGATAAASDDETQPKNKQQRLDAQVSPVKLAAVTKEADEEKTKHCCSGCGISDSAANGSLLLFDDPEEDNKEEDDKQLREGSETGNKEEKR